LRPLIAILLIPVTLAATSTAAERIELAPGAAPTELTLLASNLESTTLRLDVGSFTTEPVDIDGRLLFSVALNGAARLLEQGLPELPIVRQSIVIPDDAQMGIRVIDATFRDFDRIDVVPSKGAIKRNVDPDSVPYTFGTVYEQDAWFPAEIAGLGDPFIMRDTRGVVLELNPFQYNARTHTLRVYTSITVEVSVEGTGSVNVLKKRPGARVAEFERLYGSRYLNYRSIAGRYTPLAESGPMLIIANDAFIETTRPLADWRNQIGVPTTLVGLSTVGSTADDIKSYIQNAYDTDGIAYVLLVGDDEQMPYPVDGTQSADPVYSLLAGSDNYPEIFVGRFSAETLDQVATQVERTIEYERDPEPGADWYHKATGIASDQDGGSGSPDYEFIEAIRETLLGYTYTYVDQFYDPGVTSAEISAALNEGRSLVNYLGHGNTMGWSTGTYINGDVNGLVNDNMLPWVISTACVTGQYTDKTCFAEVWQRATNGDEPTGGVGVYASTISMSWVPPISAQLEIAHLLVSEGMQTLGGLCFNGSSKMMDEHGHDGADEFNHWHIFGDPALTVRSNTPTALAASHDGHIEEGSTSFTVFTEPSVTVALSDSGSLLGCAIADAFGEAVIEIVGSLPDSGVVTLTLTEFNCIPHIESVTVGEGTSSGDTTYVFALNQNYPNPFKASSTITFSMPEKGHARIDIFNVSGRKVRTILDDACDAGSNVATWDGCDTSGGELAAGVYFYRLETAATSETKKMLLLSR